MGKKQLPDALGEFEDSANHLCPGPKSLLGGQGGYNQLTKTKKNADYCLNIPIKNKNYITALSESFQAIIWHLLVSHPDLKKKNMKWESILK